MVVLKRPSFRFVIGVASSDHALNSPHRQTCSPAYSAGSSNVTFVVPPFLAGVFVSMRLSSSSTGSRGPPIRPTLAAVMTGVFPPGSRIFADGLGQIDGPATPRRRSAGFVGRYGASLSGGGTTMSLYGHPPCPQPAPLRLPLH